MNMPGFNADASLYQTNNDYRLTPGAEVSLRNGALPQMMMTYKEFFGMFDVIPDWVYSGGDPGGSEFDVTTAGCVNACNRKYRNNVMKCDPTGDENEFRACLDQKKRQRDLCETICREVGI